MTESTTTTHIRIRRPTKEKLEEIRKLFTLENKGDPVTLLETLDKIISEFYKQQVDR
jgi:hypothetical protein